MKAGYGVQWNQNEFRENGPNYTDLMSKKKRNVLSLSQYSQKYGGGSIDLKKRAQSQARARPSRAEQDSLICSDDCNDMDLVQIESAQHLHVV